MAWFGIDTIVNLLWLFYVLKDRLWWWLGVAGAVIILIALVCDKNLRHYCDDKRRQSLLLRCLMSFWFFTRGISSIWHSGFR